MCFVSEVLSSAKRLHVSALNRGRKIETAWVDFKSEPLYVGLKGLKVPFPPSVFNGTGREAKKNLVFNVTDSAYEELLALEAALKEVDRHAIGTASWNSWVRPKDEYPARLKCKVTSETRYFDQECRLADTPSDNDWRGLECNAVLLVKAVYRASGAAGLMTEVTDLQVLDRLPPRSPGVSLRKMWHGCT